jgi:NodT family efflux transporter outer membrane factor (OMF) lipoprotein
MAAAVALTTGCTVGPDYVRPEPAVGITWSGAMAGGLSDQPADLSGWWSHLGDPVLDTLVHRALAANNTLRAAAARVMEVKAARRGAEAGNYPTLDTSAQYQRQRSSPNTGSPAAAGMPGRGDPVNFWSAGIDAGWEMDLFGRVRRAVEAADADVQVAEHDRRGVVLSLLAEVARNYIELRAFQQRLLIARANLASQEETLSLTRTRFDAGLTSELDVTRALTNVETTRAGIPALEQGLKQASHRLSVLLGERPGSLYAELEEPAVIPVIPGEVRIGVPSELLLRRPDLLAAERRLAAATARIGVATADLYPRLILNGQLAFQASRFATAFDAGSATYGLGPTLTWNLFDAGRVRASIAAADARAQAALAEFDAAVLGALEEAENTIVAFAREQERYRALEAAVEAGRRSVEIANSQYSQGLTDFQNVLDSQRNLLALQDQATQSRARVSDNLVALYKALGGGWEIAEGPTQAVTPGDKPVGSPEPGDQPGVAAPAVAAPGISARTN